MTVTTQAVKAPSSVPAKFQVVPSAAEMTDDQGEAIAEVARCCGGIAYDIYRVALLSAPTVVTAEADIPTALARWHSRDMETQADWCVDYFRELEVVDLRAALALRTVAEASDTAIAS